MVDRQNAVFSNLTTDSQKTLTLAYLCAGLVSQARVLDRQVLEAFLQLEPRGTVSTRPRRHRGRVRTQRPGNRTGPDILLTKTSQGQRINWLHFIFQMIISRTFVALFIVYVAS